MCEAYAFVYVYVVITGTNLNVRSDARTMTFFFTVTTPKSRTVGIPCPYLTERDGERDAERTGVLESEQKM